MLGRATYLVLMAACLLVTLPLELVLKAGVYRRPRRWLAALVPVVAIVVVRRLSRAVTR